MIQGMETEKEVRAGCLSMARAGKYVGKRIHLIGIGGSGMRALAKMLLERGALVSGSDSSPGGPVERLRKNGVIVKLGQCAENLPESCDMVVRSAAIHEQNPELLAARLRGVEVLKYSQMLGRLMSECVGVAVAGTHGKSTTTAMVAYALRKAGADPSFVVGATVPQLGGPSGVGAGPHFVAEACEFDRSFLNLCPKLALILNVEEDHLDCYENIDAIVEAFRAFAALVPADGVLVANGEDRNVAKVIYPPPACEVQTFGLAAGCTWRGVELGMEDRRHRIAVEFAGQEFCRLTAPLPGRHSAYNSVAAAAILHHAGLGASQIGELLAGFTGTLRRMTLKGSVGGVTVLDDYAHHPTEIQCTLKAIHEFYEPRRVVCIFQPHQHSRTRFLLKDFAKSFALANEVIVPDIYFVRDSDSEKQYISSQDLVSLIRMQGGAATYMRTPEEIVTHVCQSRQPGDLVVTMGAGNIWEVADEIVRWLGEHR
jgi:UDP-N-acetylmuramate--alanine ligase